MAVSKVLTDIHCHILPGIDDGAKDADASGALLLSEKQQGISQIIFTPHYYADEISVEGYIKRRQDALDRMQNSLGRMGLKTALGAEVRMQEELVGMDMRPLRMGDTSYLLLEFPFLSGTYPLWGEMIVEQLLDQGIRPLFAHIDRYEYFMNDREKLDHFREMGCIFQVNADSVVSRHRSPAVLELMKAGYVHMLGSDAHSVEKRPVNLKSALDRVEKKLGSGMAAFLRGNADAVFRGEAVDPMGKPPRKKLFGIF
jgi:protein-tyrosine phosphatase